MAMWQLQFKGNAGNTWRVVPNFINFKGAKFRTRPLVLFETILWLSEERYKFVCLDVYIYVQIYLFQGVPCIPFPLLSYAQLCDHSSRLALYILAHARSCYAGRRRNICSISKHSCRSASFWTRIYWAWNLRRIIVLLIPNRVARHHPVAHLG